MDNSQENQNKENQGKKGGYRGGNRKKFHKGNGNYKQQKEQLNLASLEEDGEEIVAEKTSGKQFKSNKQGKPNNQNNQNNQNKENKPSGQGKQNKPNNSGEKKPFEGRQNDRRQNRRGNFDSYHGIEDLYGKPTEDDNLSLEELRAKIVLQSADGTKPAMTVKEERAEPAKSEWQVSESEAPATAETPVSDIFPMPADPILAQPDEESIEVIGVRFRSSGKVYYFDPKGKKCRVGDHVIVETVRGSEYGDVVFGNRKIPSKLAVTPLRPLVRIATDEDTAHEESNRKIEADALVFCGERVKFHGLGMKLIDAQMAFDNTKLLIYFSAEDRVDFRELVKDLAGQFHTRIELRQIGIRDEAKMLGGLGPCGRPLCCATFLNDFGKVTIRMAKDQNLSLNAVKNSGICGRLLCCLRYEVETYAAEAKLTPAVHSTVKTPDGVGTVISNVPLAGTVKVALGEGQNAETKVYHRDDVTVLSGKKPSAESAEKSGDGKKADKNGGKDD